MKVRALMCSYSYSLLPSQGAYSEEGSMEEEAYTGEFKILALHGGGDSPEGLMGQPGMQDLMSDLPEFEFSSQMLLTTTACAINAGTLIPRGEVSLMRIGTGQTYQLTI